MFPLIAENLVVEFKGQRILGPIGLKLVKGDIAVILGPNGSGKTTLLKSLHGIIKIKHGAVSWSCPKSESMAKQMFVFQSPVMLRRSVFENLTYPLTLCKTPKAEINRLADEWVSRISLKEVIHVAATRLSGGEKQKLALARALITKPEMLFLDEPTASLDGKTTLEIEKLLQNSAENGTTIMMSTHDIGQAKRLAKNILFLNKGKLESTQPAQTFFREPMSNNASKFIAGDIVE
ncbi:MAG: ATP-binding cassette domain-containing protein [Paracoccaceae bacterium]|nr:ATP-binding cassette domain-containing protein [Paracoccaceae bacterium]